MKLSKINKQKNNQKKESQSAGVDSVQTNKLHLFWAILILIAVPFAIYSNSLHAPFIFDDYSSIMDNPDIKNISNLKDRLIYRADSYHLKNYPTRPLTYLSFTLNYYFGGLNTYGYRLFNLIVHILVTLILFFVTKRIFFYVSARQHVLLSLIVALMFALHPMNIDPVAYIVTRSDSMSTLFYLMSIMFFIKSTESKRVYYIFSIISFMLSFASKQIAATLPLMILAFDFFFLSDMNVKKVAQKKYFHLGFWGVLTAYLLFTKIYFGNLGDMGMTWSRYSYMIFQPYAILQYIKLLFVPWGQCIDHYFDPPKTLFELRIMISFLILIAITITLS
ncbi:MAG: glycosyltransferase family 39 protein, partial [Elusimicrobia bacterium]|nr:glycosyltransferase family 39 protein [Candidatus Obscuribacterium magneticum]